MEITLDGVPVGKSPFTVEAKEGNQNLYLKRKKKD